MESSWRMGKTAESTRFPLRPVIGSLVLHALVLGWLAPVPLDVVQALPPAGFLEGRLLPAPTPKVTESVVASSVQARQPVTVKGARAAAPTVQATAASEVAGNRTEEQPVAGGTPLPQETRGSRESVGPATVAIASQPSATSGPDANGLRQYRMALASEARRWRRYPEAARRGELTGTAEVRVAIEAGGAARRAELSRSSGHAALDDAALEMLQMAVARAELPPSLNGLNFAVLLPVVFAVED